jgi:hypothetical protein
MANTAESLCLLCPVGNAFCAHKSLDCTDKRVVHSYVIRGNPAKSSTKNVVLNSLDQQRRKVGASLALFAVNFNKVKKQLDKLSVLLDELDINGLEMLIAMHCLPCIGADMEAAKCIIAEIPNNVNKQKGRPSCCCSLKAYIVAI